MSPEKAANCGNPSDTQNVTAVISNTAYACFCSYRATQPETTSVTTQNYKGLSETSTQSFDYIYF